MAAPPAPRVVAAALVIFAYLLFCAVVVLRRRRVSGGVDGADAVLLAYATQTGVARGLAEEAARSLAEAGVAARAVSLETLDAETLLRTREVLFVASTTGEGDAPDAAYRFVSDVMPRTPDLSRLRYGVLALGDRDYVRFCAFGRELDDWLRARGAMPLFERIDVDDGDAHALERWRRALEIRYGAARRADGPPSGSRWRLQRRVCLNPGSPGAPLFHLQLVPLEPTLWQAGDIAAIRPCNSDAAVRRVLDRLTALGVAVDEERGAWAAALAARALPVENDVPALAGLGVEEGVRRFAPLPWRDYSIASAPEDGTLDLVVRQRRSESGALGLGSGWLTEYLPEGGELLLDLRPNPAFHGPEAQRPLILIGAGSGIAGLRAHLQQRERQGAARNWLIYGERSPEHDRPFDAELQRGLRTGSLERLDRVFSRGAGTAVYVQHRLREEALRVREWVEAGAAVYVCGSLERLAPEVDRALSDILGEAGMSSLRREGRYRRDVY